MKKRTEHKDSPKWAETGRRALKSAAAGLVFFLLALFILAVLINAETIPPEPKLLYTSAAMGIGAAITGFLGARRGGKVPGALLGILALFVCLWVIGALSGGISSAVGLLRCAVTLLLGAVAGILPAGAKKGR